MFLDFCPIMEAYGYTASDSDTASDSSSDFDLISESEGSARPRKRKLDDRQKRYKEGRSRKAYKFQKDHSNSFEK